MPDKLIHTNKLLKTRIYSAYNAIPGTVFEVDSIRDLSSVLRANLRTNLVIFGNVLPSMLTLDNVFRYTTVPNSVKVNVAGIPGKTMNVPTKYVVVRGDNLTSISRKYGVNVDKIKEWNGLRNDVVKVNQELVIFKTISALQATLEVEFRESPEKLLHPRLMNIAVADATKMSNNLRIGNGVNLLRNRMDENKQFSNILETKSFEGVPISFLSDNNNKAGYYAGKIHISKKNYSYYTNNKNEGLNSPYGQLLMHEFGHYLQNKYGGALWYNLKCAPSSIITNIIFNDYYASRNWTEIQANTMSYYYFGCPTFWQITYPINSNFISDELKNRLLNHL